MAGNTFLNNAHAKSTSNDERACVFVFSPPLEQGLSHGAPSVQLVVYYDANSVAVYFSQASLSPHPLVGVARGWPSRMESVIIMQNGVWERGRPN